MPSTGARMRSTSLAVALALACLGACGSSGGASGPGQVVTGAVCLVASDCRGPLPMSCLQCADGTTGCAHFACDQGHCQVAYCPPQPSGVGGCCPSPWIELNGACCPACVLQGCLAPCYLDPSCQPPPPTDGGTPDGGTGQCSPGFVQAGCACCPPCVAYGCMLPCEVIPGCP